jgi:hypothetical protein
MTCPRAQYFNEKMKAGDDSFRTSTIYTVISINPTHHIDPTSTAAAFLSSVSYFFAVINTLGTISTQGNK